MKRFIVFITLVFVSASIFSQDFELPIKFTANMRTDGDIGSKIESNKLNSTLDVSFDGHSLLLTHPDGTVFDEREIETYRIIKNLRGTASVSYALQTIGENDLIEYIVIKREFHTLDMVTSICYPSYYYGEPFGYFKFWCLEDY